MHCITLIQSSVLPDSAQHWRFQRGMQPLAIVDNYRMPLTPRRMIFYLQTVIYLYPGAREFVKFLNNYNNSSSI